MSDRASCWPQLPASPGDKQAVGACRLFHDWQGQECICSSWGPVRLCLPAPNVKCKWRGIVTQSRYGIFSYLIPKLQRSEFCFTNYFTQIQHRSLQRVWVSIPFCFGSSFFLVISPPLKSQLRTTLLLSLPHSNLSCICDSSLFLTTLRGSYVDLCFPGGSVIKNSPTNAGDTGLIPPGLGKSPGEVNSNPLQYSCLEKSLHRGAWWTTVHGVTKSRTPLSTHADAGGR